MSAASPFEAITLPEKSALFTAKPIRRENNTKKKARKKYEIWNLVIDCFEIYSLLH